MPRQALRITEIFHSLQGESRSAGFPTVFVRLTGCPLRCGYCDTTYAFSGGKLMSQQQVLAQVGEFQARYVCVTGGEPLAQRACPDLLRALCDAGYRVSLETSGAMDISDVDARVSRVVDIKTPGSGEMHRNRYQDLAGLTPRDQIKFVICDRTDYQWARMKCNELNLLALTPDVLFSPSYTELSGNQLADWILEDRLEVRLQLQLHKTLWGEASGR